MQTPAPLTVSPAFKPASAANPSISDRPLLEQDSMSDTSTITATQEDLSASGVGYSSLGSIYSPRRQKSEISNAYKQGSAFYVTRRFPEALSTIKSLVKIADAIEDEHEDVYTVKQAPIAWAEKKWRVKIWSFYLTLLNDIADLGGVEGEGAFGKIEWREIVGKLEDGSIWQEVVEAGYGGNEAHVDAEVVVNLANVLLSQSPNQKKNQQYLETYLSATGPGDSDISYHLQQPNHSNSPIKDQPDHKTSSNALRDLETRISIIEIFALHVLPRNSEWELAKDFVRLSDILDADRKEEFFQTICELQEQELGDRDQYEHAVPQHDPPAAKAIHLNDIQRTDSNVTIKALPPKINRRTGSETDYGVDNLPPQSKMPPLKALPPKPVTESIPKPVRKASGTLQSRPARVPTNKPVKDVPQSTILKRTVAMFSTIQKLLANMTIHLSRNPAVLFRFVLFLVALIVAFGRRDLRQRLRRITGSGWDKVKNTVGMGVKVSYI